MIIRSATYFESLSGLSRSYVVLYDTRDHRAWLSNGLNTLLHLVRTSLREDEKGDLSDERLLNHSLLEEAPNQADPKAAVRFLTNRRNLEQPVFPALDEIRTEETATAHGGQPQTAHYRTSTTVRLKDRVTQIMEVLWQLIDHQATLDLYVSGMPIQLPRSKLEGYRFMDVATRRQVTPRVVHLRAFGGAGKSWVDFVRAIRGITLFGDGFGELISPASSLSADADHTSHSTCSRWRTMPKGKDLLAVSAYDLNKIIHQEGGGGSSSNSSFGTAPIKLAPGIFWNYCIPGAFERCGCDGRARAAGKGKVPASSTTASVASILKASSSFQFLRGRPCDRVQVLLPARLALLPYKTTTVATTNSASNPLIHLNGAFIFGRSELFPWRWPDQGDPQLEDADISGTRASSVVPAAANEPGTSLLSTGGTSVSTRSSSNVGGEGGSVSMTTPGTTVFVSTSSPQSSLVGGDSAVKGGKEPTHFRTRPGQRRIKRLLDSIRGGSSGSRSRRGRRGRRG